MTLVQARPGRESKLYFVDINASHWNGRDLNRLYFCISTCEALSSRSRKPSRKHPVFTYLVVLDDVGTKVPLGKLPPGARPSYALETSPGNFQLGYFFKDPVDPGRAQALVDALANAGFTDKGAKGAVRIMRVPGSLNGKKGLETWAAKLTTWNPDVRYTYSELAILFGVTPTDTPTRSHMPALAEGETDRVAEWQMQHQGEIGAASGPPIRELIPLICPQHELHTVGLERTNDSSTVWIPGAPGAFKCTHGHCAEFRTREYLAWMKAKYSDFPLTGNAASAEELRQVIGRTFSPETLAAQQAAEAVRREEEEVHNKAVGERARLPHCVLRPGHQPTILDATLKVLPTLDTRPFRQGGKLVYVTTTRLLPLVDPETEARTEAKVLGVERVTANWLLTEIPRKIVYLKYASRKAEERARTSLADMPPWLPKAILETHRTIGLAPELLGVVGTPTMRPDGSLLTVPGYDDRTCFYLSGDLPVTVPDAPARDDALAALKTIDGDLLQEFAFVSDSDRAVAIAAMMTIVLRPAFPHAPGVLINAPARGSGKSYLHDLIALVGTGRPAAVSIWKANREENDKRLDAMMFSQTPLIGFGNVNGTAVGGDTLNEIITADSYRPRVLGKSEAPEVSTLGTTVIINGNRLSAQEDTSDRFLRIDLDTNLDNPRDRNYRGRPAQTVIRDRGRYVAALLTIARAYVIAGRPEAEDWSSFGAWSKLVRGAFCWLGLPDIRQTTRDAAADDPDRLAVERILSIVEAHMGVDTKFSAGDFVRRLSGQPLLEMHGLLNCDYRADLAAALGMAFRSRVKDRTVTITELDNAGGTPRRRKLVWAGTSHGSSRWRLKAL